MKNWSAPAAEAFVRFGLPRIFNGLHWFFDPALPQADNQNDALHHWCFGRSRAVLLQRRTNVRSAFAYSIVARTSAATTVDPCIAVTVSTRPGRGAFNSFC